MSKRLMIISLTIALTAALVGGATMAWFTDSAESDQVSFAAGTLLVEAGGGGGLLYGIEAVSGDIYEIDVLAQTERRIFKGDGDYSPEWYPNALAFDRVNRRLYFTTSQNALLFYDFDTGTQIDADPDGILKNSDNVLGAAFGGGHYWYVLNRSGDLYQVSFDEDGKIDDITSRTMTDDYTITQGDIAIDYNEGIIYGSSGTGAGGDHIFFTYDIANDDFEKLSSESWGLQIAWGSDSILYGHRISDQEWYSIEPDSGSKTSLDFQSDIAYEDLASNYQSNWNPGDCDMVRYYARNVGTKDEYVRVKLSGEWDFPEGDPDVVEFWLCDVDPETGPNENDNWIKKDDDYFYYKHKLEPEEEALLCVMVCLDGPDTVNKYQGKTYNMDATIQAIQTSNDAVDEVEGWLWDPSD